MPETMTETITWRDAQQDPPDDDSTVMVSISGGTEPVWLGWRQDGEWFDATTGWKLDGGQVVSWAVPPEGWFPNPASSTAAALG